MSAKEEVITMIKRMPDDCNIQDIMAAVYTRYRIDKGLKALDEGNFVPHEEVKKGIGRFLEEEMEEE